MKNPLTIHCITALERTRLYLDMPTKEHGYHRIDGRKQFLCLALHDQARQDRDLHAAVVHLTDVIRDRLNGHSTLESWVRATVPGAFSLYRTDPPAFDMRTYRARLAWVDALIDELEAGKL